MTSATGKYGVAQPGIVTSEPRSNDLMLINEENLLDAASLIQNCSGMVLDLTNLPALNDAEIEALLVSLYSRMSDDSLVFIKDSVSRVEHLFRLIVDLDLDGAVVDVRRSRRFARCSCPSANRSRRTRDESPQSRKNNPSRDG